jgi:hypothetical protein
MGRLLRALGAAFSRALAPRRTDDDDPYPELRVLTSETEWLSCAHPLPMLNILGNRVSDRKRRLLGSAFCRQLWNQLDDDRVRRALETNEAVADEPARRGELDLHLACLEEAAEKATAAEGPRCRAAVLYGATEAILRDDPYVSLLSLQLLAGIDGIGLPRHVELTARHRLDPRWRAAETQMFQQAAALLRELFANPFRSVVFDPAWRTPAVVGLAEVMYTDRSFDQIALLADALTDAGCAEAEILGHCAAKQEHVRGCWLVDLILGRS